MRQEAYPNRVLQLPCSVCLVWLTLSLGQLPASAQEFEGADPYDTLYDVIMTRQGPNGEMFATNEASPAIFSLSGFPFDDTTYEEFVAALDAFAALPQEEIEAYGDIQRALLQRHLWKVYDATHPTYYTNGAGELAVYHKRHSNRRLAAQPKIASMIHRLALTKMEILALPDTLTATVNSGRFAESHDPEDLFKPFLPPDLNAKNSSWICQGDAKELIPADVHSTKSEWRSAFLSFLHAPGGRQETLQCVEMFNHGEVPPIGTQSALIEQAFLISDEGELVLSPLAISISLRAFVDVQSNPRSRTGRLRARQCVAEFVINPRRLIQGDAVMTALTPTDRRFEAGDASDIGGGDSFVRPRPRLSLCMSCHGGASRIGLKTTRPPLLRDVSPTAIIKATVAKKQEHKTWTTLHDAWQMGTGSGD